MALEYYVYAYINKKTGKPYYIGKGKGNRAYAPHGRVKTPKNKNMIVFCETHLTNTGACAIERRLIRHFGRKHIDEGGILLNIAPGGEGQDPWFVSNVMNKNPEKIRKTAEAHRGMKRSKEARENMSRAKKGKPAHNRFTYCTPHGIFKTREEAAEAIGLHISVIYQRCVTNVDKILNKYSLARAYDIDNKSEALGKTWRELGWYCGS